MRRAAERLRRLLRRRARRKAEGVGYPLLARAARHAGGQTAEIIYDAADLEAFLASGIEISSERPLLMDRFIEGAIEVGVDAISDGETTLVCGVMEFIEQAGVHSGDSACSLPPYSLPDEIVEQIKQQTRRIASEIGVKGLMGAQFAVKSGEIYLLEVIRGPRERYRSSARRPESTGPGPRRA